ncbi:MAG: hypothetical protein U0805_04635 [Pirellulales bacterium]
MAIKPPELLNRLPSVSELLDKPPVRALVDRWNRSTVANNLRTYLDELRTDLERRAADLPSIRELAERAAKFVVSRQHQSLGVAINATGRIAGAPWINTPLSEAALERMIAFGREFATAPVPDSVDAPSEISVAICRLTGAESAVVVHSYSSAVWLTLAALATNREVLVARAEVGAVDGVDSLPKLAAAAGTILKDVGATNRTTIADFESAASSQAAAIFTLSNDSYQVIGDTTNAELSDLVALAHNRQLTLIDALGATPLVPAPETIPWPRRSAQASIAAGADVVILRGDALVSGPACGIILGNQEAIRRIAAHPLCAALRIDAFRAAGLAATLVAYENQSSAPTQEPIWQCLRTSTENLRNRAERMAGQLAHADGIATATAIETHSPLSAAITGEGWPSYGVALTPRDSDIAALDHRLQSARLPIRGRVEGDRVILDLRTVLPRQDRLLVDSLLGAHPAPPEQPAEPVAATP